MPYLWERRSAGEHCNVVKYAFGFACRHPFRHRGREKHTGNISDKDFPHLWPAHWNAARFVLDQMACDVFSCFFSWSSEATPLRRRSDVAAAVLGVWGPRRERLKTWRQSTAQMGFAHLWMCSVQSCWSCFERFINRWSCRFLSDQRACLMILQKSSPQRCFNPEKKWHLKTLDNSVPCFLSCQGFIGFSWSCHLLDPATQNVLGAREIRTCCGGVAFPDTSLPSQDRLILFSLWIPRRLQLCFDSYQQEQSVLIVFVPNSLGFSMQPRCVRLGLGGCVRITAPLRSCACCLFLNLCLPLSPLQSAVQEFRSCSSVVQ